MSNNEPAVDPPNNNSAFARRAADLGIAVHTRFLSTETIDAQKSVVVISTVSVLVSSGLARAAQIDISGVKLNPAPGIVNAFLGIATGFYLIRFFLYTWSDRQRHGYEIAKRRDESEWLADAARSEWDDAQRHRRRVGELSAELGPITGDIPEAARRLSAENWDLQAEEEHASRVWAAKRRVLRDLAEGHVAHRRLTLAIDVAIPSILGAVALFSTLSRLG